MSWQRKWFFWLESLQITAGERRVVLTLLVAGVITTGVAEFGPTRTIYDKEYYEPVIAEFQRLSAVQSKEQEELLARYYPRDEQALPFMPEQDDFFTANYTPLVLKKDNSGTQVEEKRPDEEKSTENSRQPDSGRKPVHIQTAGEEDLVTLPGIGPVTAERILAYREENGPIQKIDDLMNVSGIGPVTLDNIREYILID